jgi:transmembrane sensor
MAGKRRRRALRRGAVGLAGAGAAALAVYMWWPRADRDGGETIAEPAPAPIAPSPPPDPPPTPIPQATAYAELDDGAELEVMEFEPDVLTWRLDRGRARFKRAPARRVEVTAGPVRVIARASDFSVARYRDATEVWAVTGPVDVLLDDRTHQLGPGEHRRFADPVGRDRGDGARTPAPAAADWRALAQDGRFKDAYRLLRAAGPQVKIADLLLAADVYRLSGHPAEAIAPLQAVARDHSADPRAPLAAFTLGRILLDDLGRPAAAARAFRRAGEVDPDGQMAEDALAREVEAWSKAGDQARARAAAERYLDRYPRGHRLHAVKQYGGL